MGENMAETADAVVIGGGILGVSTAYYLGKLGFGKVALLEKQTLAAGSTGKSAAVVRSFYSNEVCVKLARRAVDIFEHFSEETGEDIGFNRIGYMVITDQPSTVDRVLELHRKNGIRSSKLAPQEIKKLLPHMNLEGVAAAGYEPDSGYADPFLTVAALVQKGRKLGLTTYQKREVVKINAKNGWIESVDTTRGPISTKVVLNAGGPWANKFHPFPEIPLPLRLSREQDCVFDAPPEFKDQPVVSDSILAIYSRSDVGGRLLAGVGYPKEEEPCDPDHVDERSDEGFGELLKQKLLKRFPTLSNAAIVHGWSGMYTITPDWHPIVGKAPGVEGYYLAVGGSGHSFKIGPPIGESLAAMIAGKKPEIDISALRYERFKENETFKSVWGPGNRA
jgi:sarcosine oxidase, subunit beta